MLNQLFIGLGSNIGDKTAYLNQALDYLNNEQDVEVTQVSSFMITQSVSTVPQPDYLNAVAEIRTLLSSDDFFCLTRSIELKLGRHTKEQYDPRTIDIDILFFNQDIFLSDDLSIPHPLLHERLFVLEPLVEIAPTWIHPVLNQSIKQLYDHLYECTY